jgi:hypothetical protein
VLVSKELEQNAKDTEELRKKIEELRKSTEQWLGSLVPNFTK